MGSSNPYFAPIQAYFGGLDTLAQSMSPMKGLARWQLEVMGLMSRRAQAYMEFPSRLQQCRTPQDLVNEQARFLRTSFEQYIETTQRIAEAWAQAGSLSYGPASTRAPVRDYISFGDNASGSPPRANGYDRRAA